MSAEPPADMAGTEISWTAVTAAELDFSLAWTNVILDSIISLSFTATVYNIIAEIKGWMNSTWTSSSETMCSQYENKWPECNAEEMTKQAKNNRFLFFKRERN